MKPSPTQTHTPTPWQQLGREFVFGENMWAIGEMYYNPKKGDGHSNANFVVRAVNSHEELLEALRIARDMAMQEKIPSFERCQDWLNLIDKAEGRS